MFHEQWISKGYDKAPSELDSNNFSARGVGGVFRREATIFFQDQMDGILKIPSSLGQRSALGVYTRNFFHPGNVPTALLLDYGCELPGHTANVSTARCSSEDAEMKRKRKRRSV